MKIKMKIKIIGLARIIRQQPVPTFKLSRPFPHPLCDKERKDKDSKYKDKDKDSRSAPHHPAAASPNFQTFPTISSPVSLLKLKLKMLSDFAPLRLRLVNFCSPLFKLVSYAFSTNCLFYSRPL